MVDMIQVVQASKADPKNAGRLCGPHLSPHHKGHPSGSGRYWIWTGVRDGLGFGELEQFGRMENTTWVI